MSGQDPKEELKSLSDSYTSRLPPAKYTNAFLRAFLANPPPGAEGLVAWAKEQNGNGVPHADIVSALLKSGADPSQSPAASAYILSAHQAATSPRSQARPSASQRAPPPPSALPAPTGLFAPPSQMGGSMRTGGSPAVALGDVVDGYKLRRHIGTGGMGAVFLGRHPDHGDRAVKFIKPGLLADESAVRRFVKEGQAVLSLTSRRSDRRPGLEFILPTHAVGTHKNTPYIVMDLVPPLEQKVNGSNEPHLTNYLDTVPEGQRKRTAVRAFVKCFDAWREYADSGVVHRDIKPQNILMLSDGSPRIADFGLVKMGVGGGSIRSTGEGQTLEDAALGTPDHFSPEQARGDSKFVTPSSDGVSFGIALASSVAGVKPKELMGLADGTTIAGFLNFHATREGPIPIKEEFLNDDCIDPELHTIISKLTEADPSFRYRSPDAAYNDLLQYSVGNHKKIKGYNFFDRLKKRGVTPRRVGIGALALTTLGLVVGGLYFGLRTDPAVVAHNQAISTKIDKLDDDYRTVDRLIKASNWDLAAAGFIEKNLLATSEGLEGEDHRLDDIIDVQVQVEQGHKAVSKGLLTSYNKLVTDIDSLATQGDWGAANTALTAAGFDNRLTVLEQGGFANKEKITLLTKAKDDLVKKVATGLKDPKYLLGNNLAAARVEFDKEKENIENGTTKRELVDGLSDRIFTLREKVHKLEGAGTFALAEQADALAEERNFSVFVYAKDKARKLSGDTVDGSVSDFTRTEANKLYPLLLESWMANQEFTSGSDVGLACLALSVCDDQDTVRRDDLLVTTKSIIKKGPSSPQTGIDLYERLLATRLAASTTGDETITSYVTAVEGEIKSRARRLQREYSTMSVESLVTEAPVLVEAMRLSGRRGRLTHEIKSGAWVKTYFGRGSNTPHGIGQLGDPMAGTRSRYGGGNLVQYMGMTYAVGLVFSHEFDALKTTLGDNVRCPPILTSIGTNTLKMNAQSLTSTTDRIMLGGSYTFASSTIGNFNRDDWAKRNGVDLPGQDDQRRDWGHAVTLSVANKLSSVTKPNVMLRYGLTVNHLRKR